MPDDENLRPRLWPLFELRLATERLVLAPVGDSDLDELSALAQEGIHPPDSPPFSNLWTNRTGREFEVGFAQYFWAQRARWSEGSWTLPFAVRLGGRLIGVQQVESTDFAVLRTVSTGSWLGRSFQGGGLGTEMRSAVLSLAFDGLGAEVAITGAYDYNAASIRVSEKLGYDRNGVRRDNVRGGAAEAVLFRMTKEAWAERARPRVWIDGLDVCRGLFGAASAEQHLVGVG